MSWTIFTIFIALLVGDGADGGTDEQQEEQQDDSTSSGESAVSIGEYSRKAYRPLSEDPVNSKDFRLICERRKLRPANIVSEEETAQNKHLQIC